MSSIGQGGKHTAVYDLNSYVFVESQIWIYIYTRSRYLYICQCGSTIECRAFGTALRYICNGLATTSTYAPLTTSLKNEFRRGSSKLLPNDRLLYFHFVSFILEYHRLRFSHFKRQLAHELAGPSSAAAAASTTSATSATSTTTTATVHVAHPLQTQVDNYDHKAMLATLDMFSFNFVLQSIEVCGLSIYMCIDVYVCRSIDLDRWIAFCGCVKHIYIYATW